MNLPQPLDSYDAGRERLRNLAIEQADRNNHKRGRDIEVGKDERIVLTAADGGRWALTVNNDGTLNTSAV